MLSPLLLKWNSNHAWRAVGGMEGVLLGWLCYPSDCYLGGMPVYQPLCSGPSRFCLVSPENLFSTSCRTKELGFISAHPPFLFSGSGEGDLLPDGMWTLLFVLQANVAGSIHTGRYALCESPKSSSSSAVQLIISLLNYLFY